MLRASTAATGTPARFALYSMNARSCAKAQPECRLRCFFLTVIRSRMWVRFSNPIPRTVPLALATMALLMTWFWCLRKKDSRLTDAAQDSFGRARALALKVLAGLVEPPANFLDPFANEVRAVAGGRDVGDTQVHADVFTDDERRVFGHIAGREQVELPVAVDQIDLTLEASETRLLVLTEDVRNENATIERQDADLIDTLPRQDAARRRSSPPWA